ncbi:Tim44 domain-containing protein [Advenella mimigardefordensis]|uniref:TIM44-like domain-containing protein n=1 Tax=Advenella mimigardefordensis (strain DSM 17166 / LMG 22922 / DPN7) TaxID=1247726 RepID=W0P7F8_ADVMD|nr:TIM44-like domain-containing protein [Advenella mimigardefordensis]AHG62671.1 TIM44-like domain-containing protein [Advenella mimigardefordensis DPN7]
MFKKWSKFLAAAMIVVSSVSMLAVTHDAEARRMGGGSSFGRQSSNIMKNRAPAAQTPNAVNRSSAAPAGAAANAGAAAQRSGFSRFLGPIAGIAAGLGIAALLSSLGLGGAMLEFLSSALLIAIVIFGVMFIVRRLRGGQARPAFQGASPMQRQSNEPAQGSRHQYTGQGTTGGAQQQNGLSATDFSGNAQAAAEPADKSWFIPGDFDTPAFLQTAKKQFVTIQGLWDKGDIEELKNYLTEDLVAELSPQITSRAGQSRTEVVLLNAELLGIEQVQDGHLASVRFSGMLREDAQEAAFRFEEVWNLYKENNSGWLLAGIQQIPVENAS